MRTNIYIRLDNQEFWKAIPDKGEWVNQRIEQERTLLARPSNIQLVKNGSKVSKFKGGLDTLVDDTHIPETTRTYIKGICKHGAAKGLCKHQECNK